MISTLAAAGGFGVDHIAMTAAITGILTLVAALVQLPRGAWLDAVVIGVLAAASVFPFRISANMPQLNDDGLPGFSWSRTTVPQPEIEGFSARLSIFDNFGPSGLTAPRRMAVQSDLVHQQYMRR